MSEQGKSTQKPIRRYVARVVIEFITPFHVGIGEEGLISDAPVVTDCNGVPALPGSSLAGVLREFFAKFIREDNLEGKTTRSVFGFQNRREKDEEKTPAGQGSRLRVTWGCIHDSQGNPIEGIAVEKRLRDPVVANALAPTLRDHVKVNHLGVADAEQRGKFDELTVCAGHRFTFEMELVESESESGSDADAWDKLLSILCEGGLRLGGKTRRGLGAFKVVDLRQRVFDLSEESGFKAYCAHPVSLAVASPGLGPDCCRSYEEKGKKLLAARNQHLEIELKLTPLGYWMFGAGDDEMGADMAPVCDFRIDWPANEDGRVSKAPLFLISGSAVKGALSHRLAFHYNALKGVYADDRSPEDLKGHIGELNEAVGQLFGSAKNEPKRGIRSQDAGQRGRVMINDLLLAKDGQRQQFVNHVAIDRFTGGAMTQSGALFNERPIWGWQGQEGIPLRIAIEKEALKEKKVAEALLHTLEDLCEGRLQLGGGSGRGLGYFSADQGNLQALKTWITGLDDSAAKNPAPAGPQLQEAHD